MISIGIDTGGTCTDAVILDLDTKEILAEAKTLTTKHNLEIGIGKALDLLPAEMLKKAQMLSLSTTLATNACVENKGSRAKLLVIGTTPELITRIEAALKGYGVDDISQIVALDARAENMFPDPYDPDWDELEAKCPELFCDCESVGIVQTFPRANGGRFELTAIRVLKKKLTIPMTIAYDVCTETDFLKICASTMLNARLIPLITEFIGAVHNVMDRHGLDIPLTIVRSDGTLMSEEMARIYPVETLLCGPASSIIGALKLTDEKDAIVVDMGGTTTDLAIVRDGEPLTAQTGIHIGQYKTSMRGLNARALFLGGDTEVQFKDDRLVLGTNKIVPISILAEQYSSVLPALKAFVPEKFRHTRNIHEFYVLQKEITNYSEYTEYERRACEILAGGPLMVRDFAAKLGEDIYTMKVSRLEQEGIIIRSGITPTDMMVLCGDLKLYDSAAALEMAKYASFITGLPLEDIPGKVYSLVIERLYKSIGYYVLQQQYPENEMFRNQQKAEPLLDILYKQALISAFNPKAYSELPAQLMLKTEMAVIGVGAPTYLFAPKVAEMLGTKAILPEHAYIANAVGAAACNLKTVCDVIITVHYNEVTIDGYSFATNGSVRRFERREDAVAECREYIKALILEKAALQGLGKNPEITISESEKRFGDPETGLLFKIIISAVASRRYR